MDLLAMESTGKLGTIGYALASSGRAYLVQTSPGGATGRQARRERAPTEYRRGLKQAGRSRLQLAYLTIGDDEARELLRGVAE